ncbi:MAG: site-specific integrase [Promethearchaeota archaeon]
MNEADFQEYLKKKEVDETTINNYLLRLRDYEKYLNNLNLTLEKVEPNNLAEYTEHLVSIDQDSVIEFLRAIINYANYIKKYDFITEVIDISESYNAMDTLYSRIAEVYGEKTRDDVFKDLVIPSLGVHPEKKPSFTKEILNRVEAKLGHENTIKLLSPCLHGRPPDDIEGDKKALKELGIDGFLLKKHRDLIQRLEKHRDEGTLEFAQYIDENVIEYVRNNQIFAGGIRDGNYIYVSKLPYQTSKYLNAKNEQMKKFFLCYCPWIRGAFKDGTETEILKNFCHCSAGWYKLYWDQIFEQPIKVEPIETALNGALECTFSIEIPKSFL